MVTKKYTNQVFLYVLLFLMCTPFLNIQTWKTFSLLWKKTVAENFNHVQKIAQVKKKLPLKAKH